jgi:hypothetical protein
MSGYGGDRDASRRQVRASPSGKTTNAVEILRHRFITGKPDMEAMVEEERTHAEVARRVHELRTKAGLSTAIHKCGYVANGKEKLFDRITGFTGFFPKTQEKSC